MGDDDRLWQAGLLVRLHDPGKKAWAPWMDETIEAPVAVQTFFHFVGLASLREL